MFTVDATITDLKAKERNLSKVLFSMNTHQVATPEMSAEDAKSYVFFFREGGGFLAYIGLYFLHSDRKLYYKHSANPFAESEMSNVENEARSFAEDMGAMLDEIDIVKMSAEEKNRWIDEQDIFSVKKQTIEETESQTTSGAPSAQSAPQETTAAAPAAPVEGSAPAQQVRDVSFAAAVPARAVEPPAVQPAPVAPPVQPAPVVQSVPEAQTAPISQQFSVPSTQHTPEIAPAPAAQTHIEDPSAASVENAPVPSGPMSQPQPQTSPATPPQRKKQTAPVQDPVQTTEPAPPSGAASLQQAGDVLEEAVKAGIVKSPKSRLQKDIRTSVGVVSRDKEALAHLLASF